MVVGAVPPHRSDIKRRARADLGPDSRPESAAEARFERAAEGKVAAAVQVGNGGERRKRWWR
jgi:hypothetical protein